MRFVCLRKDGASRYRKTKIFGGSLHEYEMDGLFLSLDGLDGCGKSTQIELLKAWLAERGLEVCQTREPGGTNLGEALREILLHREDLALGMMSEMLLYMASRAQLMEEVVLPALAAGKVVIADRFLLANAVYQGSAGGLDPEVIWEIGRTATASRMPDLTFLLDLDAEAAQARLSGSLDRLESRGLTYMQKVRQGYLDEVAKLGSDAFLIVDATQEPEAIHQTIVRTLEARLG